MKIALLCSGLGTIYRGHEIFARDLFDLVRDSVDITLFKGCGDAAPQEVVIPNIGRDSPLLQHIHMAASPKWATQAVKQEQLRIEAVTFAYAALAPLLAGGFDIIHCLEQEVCELIYGFRHLFAVTPKVVFSNGGAILGPDLPPCDYVQEYTPYNLARSARQKAFMVPHGVDINLFHPGVVSDFRARAGIPASARVAISVGTVCYWHKRMDYVIREAAAVPGLHLLIVGQESADTPAIQVLGAELMPGRITFTKMAHDDLPLAYAAADVFVLGSLFETFGIVYIEAMAMGLPVISTKHPNQRGIIQEGIFIDMQAPGALTAALRDTPENTLRALGLRGREVAVRDYSLETLKQQYIQHYESIAAATANLPQFNFKRRIGVHALNFYKQLRRLA
jgi:glycosyltransferase involved in cell wall biosynthesis